ncbi:MAG: hypothetical protein A2451_14325 [Bdellovibrionales bacterium RIFOXYC2_FULL_39_8]|nr:MAG: hypothetical protein A2451_14325 [Bdellovibrionales bacterium RIFOXYC2_FULL_39_8]
MVETYVFPPAEAAEAVRRKRAGKLAAKLRAKALRAILYNGNIAVCAGHDPADVGGYAEHMHGYHGKRFAVNKR